MTRNLLKREEEETQEIKKEIEKKENDNQIVEREITLSLVNDKLNYLINLLNKIAKAAEIKIEE